MPQILDYGSEKRKPEGKITESLGNIHAPGADILAVVKAMASLLNFRSV